MCSLDHSYSLQLLDVMTEKQNKEVEEGDDVILTCIYNRVTTQHFGVTWYQIHSASGMLEKIWSYSSDISGNDSDKPQKDFSSLLERANSDIPVRSEHSIKIKNVSQEDEAVYMCELEIDYGRMEGSANTSVNVLSKYWFSVVAVEFEQLYSYFNIFFIRKQSQI